MFLILKSLKCSLCYRECNSGPWTDLGKWGKKINYVDRCFKPINPVRLWIWTTSMVWGFGHCCALWIWDNSIHPSKPCSLDDSHLSPLVGARTIPKNRASPHKVSQLSYTAVIFTLETQGAKLQVCQRKCRVSNFNKNTHIVLRWLPKKLSGDIKALRNLEIWT